MLALCVMCCMATGSCLKLRTSQRHLLPLLAQLSWLPRAAALPPHTSQVPATRLEPRQCPARPALHLQSYMLRATALLPHTRYSDSEWRSFTQLSAHQVLRAVRLCCRLYQARQLPWR